VDLLLEMLPAALERPRPGSAPEEGAQQRQGTSRARPGRLMNEALLTSLSAIVGPAGCG
jgi:hypothetical protein